MFDESPFAKPAPRIAQLAWPFAAAGAILSLATSVVTGWSGLSPDNTPVTFAASTAAAAFLGASLSAWLRRHARGYLAKRATDHAAEHSALDANHYEHLHDGEALDLPTPACWRLITFLATAVTGTLTGGII